MSDCMERTRSLPRLPGEMELVSVRSLREPWRDLQGQLLLKVPQRQWDLHRSLSGMLRFYLPERAVSHKPRWRTRSHGRATIQVAPAWEEGRFAGAGKQIKEPYLQMASIKAVSCTYRGLCIRSEQLRAMRPGASPMPMMKQLTCNHPLPTASPPHQLPPGTVGSRGAGVLQADPVFLLILRHIETHRWKSKPSENFTALVSLWPRGFIILISKLSVHGTGDPEGDWSCFLFLKTTARVYAEHTLQDKALIFFRWPI